MIHTKLKHALEFSHLSLNRTLREKKGDLRNMNLSMFIQTESSPSSFEEIPSHEIVKPFKSAIGLKNSGLATVIPVDEYLKRGIVAVITSHLQTGKVSIPRNNKLRSIIYWIPCTLVFSPDDSREVALFLKMYGGNIEDYIDCPNTVLCILHVVEIRNLIASSVTIINKDRTDFIGRNINSKDSAEDTIYEYIKDTKYFEMTEDNVSDFYYFSPYMNIISEYF